jgi:hypothetical protein
MYKNKHIAISFIAALIAGAACLLPASAQSQEQISAPSGNIQLAQNTESDEYMPPWQRKNRHAKPEDDGSPQQITPRRKSASPPTRYDPPPPGYRNRGRNGEYDAPSSGQYGHSLPSHRDGPRRYDDDTYTVNEIVDAGHRFFGGVSKGLAKVVEYAFKEQGRPNGYILGEEGGGALVVGLRYGEGVLYTKNAGRHRIYWQGPSVGYDAGAEGSKTLILVYNLSDIRQIYNRFAGIDGSAYFVGGVGITFQTYDDVVLAPIRSGVGIRLGANVGYLKYTRSPTWNPF